MRRLLAEEARAHARSWMYLERTRCLHDISFWLVTSGLLIASVHAWRSGAITTGGVVVACTLALRVLIGSRELALSLLGLADQLGAVANSAEVLCAPPDIKETRDTPELRVRGGSVSFQGMWFAQEGAPALFSDFRLDVPAGQRLGIVGPSGAGKSTLFRLLQRQVEPQRGEIRIDGQRIDAVTQKSLAAAFAVVTQEVELFHRSVLENLRYGRADASQAEVLAAAKAAGCDAFIRGLPMGYDTLVGERGVRLSGGQRQRIAIARALLKDAPVVLLDEATSAIDPTNERLVQAALAELVAGKTLLVVAHRLTTIRSADQIVALDGGRIVERGTHDELLDAGGLYTHLWAQRQQATTWRIHT
jgi:ATP-binding cassette, subfamily B, bacterial